MLALICSPQNSFFLHLEKVFSHSNAIWQVSTLLKECCSAARTFGITDSMQDDVPDVVASCIQSVSRCTHADFDAGAMRAILSSVLPIRARHPVIDGSGRGCS